MENYRFALQIVRQADAYNREFPPWQFASTRGKKISCLVAVLASPVISMACNFSSNGARGFFLDGCLFFSGATQ
jgi:hypothetical protein